MGATMKKINLYKLITIIKISIFSIIFITNIAVYSSDETEQKNEELKKIEEIEDKDEKEAFEKKIEELQKISFIKTTPTQRCKLQPEKKLFINARDNIIKLIVTYKDNKQILYVLQPGLKQYVNLIPSQIKKCICRDKNQEKDLVIPTTALNSYSVFIFNFDTKPEQIHFIDIKQKTYALNKIKNMLRNAQLFMYYDKKLIESLIKKVNDIQDRTIYLQ